MTRISLFEKRISIIGLVQVFAFLTLILSVATIFNGYHRFLELFSHFKFQYFLSSFVCLSIFLASKHYKSAFVMGSVFTLNLFFVIPWYFSPVNNISESTLEIKLLHSNVNTKNRDFQAFVSLVNSESPDIFVVQEVNERWLAELKVLETSYPYKHTNPREDNFGIAIYSKHAFDDVRTYYWGVSNLPSLKAEFTISGQRFTAIATHPLPPVNGTYYQSRNSQIDAISKVSREIDSPLVLIGDLNVSMWSVDYDSLELDTDLSNARKGFGLLPTWPTMLPMFMIPIDHYLVSSHFVVRDLKVGAYIGSDHLPIIVELGLKG